MKPNEIVSFVGAPGVRAILILDILFSKKRKIIDDDLRDFCKKYDVGISSKNALIQAKSLEWAGVVKVGKSGRTQTIIKGKDFDVVVKFIKKKMVPTYGELLGQFGEIREKYEEQNE
jgi:hypothetical protein